MSGHAYSVLARRPDALVTSVLVTERGGHRGIRIWIKGQCVGELVIGETELEALLEVLDVGEAR